ncbi:hypothetical protein [Arthrobacter sp. VKM Ac-2550]|uniref:hypothetical protein n=1 Tax=Crystallibacter permensis TaxID=1938888 RepID=UPI00222632FF|nr:hypothetical protein [Arthrobacter sp. VKM Ac-2550]MCW2134135.1 hypothetical protein [Arthrobacter sp. VKM Ac-2550]
MNADNGTKHSYRRRSAFTTVTGSLMRVEKAQETDQILLWFKYSQSSAPHTWLKENMPRAVCLALPQFVLARPVLGTEPAEGARNAQKRKN